MSGGIALALKSIATTPESGTSRHVAVRLNLLAIGHGGHRSSRTDQARFISTPKND
jgi:hypothetical protein